MESSSLSNKSTASPSPIVSLFSGTDKSDSNPGKPSSFSNSSLIEFKISLCSWCSSYRNGEIPRLALVNYKQTPNLYLPEFLLIVLMIRLLLRPHSDYCSHCQLVNTGLADFRLQFRCVTESGQLHQRMTAKLSRGLQK